jgi:ABC-2 type transport system permease protein
MRKTWIIARRELASFFDSLIAYILLAVFLGVGGIMTWWYGFLQQPVLEGHTASLLPFFVSAYVLLILFIPALTMRTLAEERKSGTLDLLLTKSVTDWQIVFGKFIACLMLIMIALLCTLPYYITVARIGDVDNGAVITGYFALVLMSAAYIALGIFASSISGDQIVAFLVALFMGVILHVLFAMATGYSPGCWVR